MQPPVLTHFRMCLVAPKQPQEQETAEAILHDRAQTPKRIDCRRRSWVTLIERWDLMKKKKKRGKRKEKRENDCAGGQNDGIALLLWWWLRNCSQGIG